jgi:uncharacterized protein (TIGR03437 family)
MASLRSVLCILIGMCLLGAGAAQAQTVTVVSGNGQVIPAVHLGAPLVVLVRDASGNPLPDVKVNWTLGVGQLGNISNPTTTTGTNGQATNTFIGASPSLGVAYVQSTVTATYETATASFNLTSAAIVSSIVQVQGQVTSPSLSQLPLTGAAGTQGTVPVTAYVQALTFVEGGSVGVANVALTITQDNPADVSTVACAGGTVFTAASGIATCNVVFGGKIGSGTFTINLGGLQSFPGYGYKVIAGPPAAFAIISGNNQIGTPGQTLSLPLVAQLTDMGGNVLANVPVSFAAVLPGTATLSDVNPTTDNNGRVSAIVTLGNVAGPVQIRVSTQDGKASAIFTVTVNVIIGQMTIVAGNQQTATTNTPFADPLIVQVVDNNGNPVVGAPVTFTVTSGSAIFGTPSVTTGSNGQASTTVTAGATPGPIQVAASTTSSSGQTFSRIFFLNAIPPGPQCTPGSTFYNGASFVANFISPGGVATIYCKGIAPGIQGSVVSYNFGPLPTQVANVTVQFDGVFAPIYNVTNLDGSESVTVQVPFETTPGTAVPVTVTADGASTTGLTADVSPGAPGIFEYLLSDGVTLNAVQVRPDGSFVSPTNPAHRGEVITAYVTGLIPAAGAIGTNSFAPPDSQVDITTPVIVAVNNAGVAPPTVFYAPNLIGAWEVQFTVPSNAPTGASIPFAVGIPINGKTVVAKRSKMPIQ